MTRNQQTLLAEMALGSAPQFTGGRQKRFGGVVRRWLNLLVGACLWLVSVSAGGAPAPTTEDITSFQQIYNLNHAEALKGRSFRFKGVVLCYDSEWGQMYLHDGRDTDYINPQNLGTQPRFGQQVEITGATTGGSPAWTNLNLAILGPGTLPAAKRLALPQLASDFGQWIETSGRVRVAETSRERLALLLSESGGNCLVYVMGLPGTNDFKWLLDCKVRVRGINASKVVNGRLESASIMAPGISEVTILESPKTNPFQTPVVSIGGLLNRELGPWTNNRVRISGLVSTYQPGQYLIVKDPTGIIRAQVVQVNQVLPDERVDVWGFLAASSDGIGLNDAYFAVVQPPRSIASPSSPGSPARTNLPGVLTKVSDILKLRRDEAAESIPVRLRGVMTYADAEWRIGFFQDQGGAVFVRLDQKDVRPGQWVELTGQTGPGGFAPEVLNSAIQVLGITNLPTPAKVDLTDLSNGNLDAQWIEMEGIVRRVTGQWGHVHLSVMTREGRFKALLPGFQGQAVPTQLIDARVSIQGACGSELNARGQLSGITLHVPSLEQIRILEPARTDPFAAETTRIEAVATFDPDRLTGRRVKVSGVITLRIPGQGFFLQDASGGIRVQTQQTNEVHTGELVEVLGFPVMGDFSPALDEAIFRTTGSGSLPVPAKITAEHILLHGTNDGVVVEMEARLLQDVPRSANPQLVLQDGQIIFRAQIETPTQSEAIPALQSGSLVRVTGVCTIEGSERHEPKAFRLRLRQPDDIELLEAPPWWSSRHTFMLAGGMVLLIAAALAWAGLLRRQVRAQTEVIQRKLEEGKKFAESLAREKNLLATLIDHLPDIVFIKDREGRFLLTNRAHTQFHGAASKEHFPGKSPFEVFPPEVARSFAETDRKVLEEGLHVFDNEQSLRDAHGNLRWVSSTKVPLRDGSGNVIGLVGISRDVTERRQAEAVLVETSALLEALLQNTTDSIYFKDLQSRFVHFSRKVLDNFHLTHPDALKGRTDLDFFSEEHARPAFEAEQKIIRTGKPIFNLEEKETHLDGHVTWVLTSKMTWRDKAGNVIGTMGISRDITERKRIEDQLFQSQKLETVGKLAGGVAHEFNSIMTVIIGQSEWLLNELPPGNPLCKNATEIRQAAERAATLTRQLLAYGRKQILQPEILDLNSVLAGMEGTLRHLLGRSADVRMAPAAGLKTVKADAGQIEQVIMNLAMNAADAMPNGGKLTLETANVTLDQEYVSRFPELKAGDYVMLAITDTGTGMRAEVKARIFEPFFTTKGVGQGTGLGLSTCYGIIKQSGGHISVDSELARGATFKIFLPQVEPETKIARQRPDSPDLPRGTETILLVEDDPALREMAAALLRRLGYTVLAAANGIEALSLQQQRDLGPIDLLFADVVMPLMSGQELSERMRALSPHTRILFTSAYTEHAIVRQDGLNQGVAPLQKPFTPSALAHKLREVLDQPSAPKPDTAQKTVSFTKISAAEKTPEK